MKKLFAFIKRILLPEPDDRGLYPNGQVKLWMATVILLGILIIWLFKIVLNIK